MTIIKKVAKTLLALTFFTFSLGVSAAPDNLLEHMRARFAQKGSAGVAELAKCYGLSTRVADNKLLISVVIDRAVGTAAHCYYRLSRSDDALGNFRFTSLHQPDDSCPVPGPPDQIFPQRAGAQIDTCQGENA